MTNPPFDYLRDKRGVDISGYKGVADLLFDLSRRLAEQFAADLVEFARHDGQHLAGALPIKPTEHSTHFFYDFLLVQFAGDIAGSTDSDLRSACLDGIHWHRFGQPSQVVVSSVIAFWATSERCYQITFIEDFDVFRASRLLGLSMEPEQHGLVNTQFLGEMLSSLLKSLRQSLPSEIAKVLGRVAAPPSQ